MGYKLKRLLLGLFSLHGLQVLTPQYTCTRLEMATKLRMNDVESLSLYWRDQITELLLLEKGKEDDNVILNLASME